MYRLRAILIVALLATACGRDTEPASAPASPAYVRPPDIGDGWLTTTPEELGLKRAPLEEMTAAIQAGIEYRNTHSVLIVKDKRLVYEAYFTGDDPDFARRGNNRVTFTRDTRHTLRSMTKSVVATLMGIAVGSGAIATIDTAVYDYFPDYASLRTTERRQILIRHMLDMRAGLEWNENIPYTDSLNSEIRMNRNEDPIRFALDQPVVAAPGTIWNYSGGSTQVLAEIVERATHRPIADYARERLWKPLGIKNVDWVAIRSGKVSAPAGLHIIPRDQAKIGLVYADSGRWNSQQVIPAAWVNGTLNGAIVFPDSLREMGENAVVVSGYGRQWWYGRFTMPYGQFTAHWASGNGGQYIFMIPVQHLVVVVNAGNYDQGNDSWHLILERAVPWAMGMDSSYRLLGPRAFMVVTSKTWPTVSLDSAERTRISGTYEYDGKRLRIWQERGVLQTTTFYGRASEVLQLAPVGKGVFAFARYHNGELVRIYGPTRRLHVVVQDGKVVGFENRSLTGEVFVAAKKVD